MRILLQHKSTGLYLRDGNAWSGNCAEAMDFVSSTAALDFCAAHQMEQVQVVLRFEEEQHDIVLPVVPGSEASNPPRPAA